MPGSFRGMGASRFLASAPPLGAVGQEGSNIAALGQAHKQSRTNACSRAGASVELTSR